MAEIVNLRMARKRAARAEKERTAAENRQRFGRSKSERETVSIESERFARNLDGHRRDREETDKP